MSVDTNAVMRMHRVKEKNGEITISPIVHEKVKRGSLLAFVVSFKFQISGFLFFRKL